MLKCHGLILMDILQVCPVSYDESGGVVEHIRNISERLAEKHNITVYATNSGSKFPRCEVINGVKVEKFRRYAPGDAYFFSWDMLLRLRKADFDIVHGHCYHAFPAHFSRLAKRRKFVVTTHFHGVGHSVFRDSLLRLLKPCGGATLKKADKIIAVSEYEKSLILKKFGFLSGKVVVIPNGVDLSEFAGLWRRNHDFRSILCVGWLLWYKGVQHLVEVLPRLGSDVILEIVGRGPLRTSLEERAKKLKVLDRVRFYEYLPRRELLQKYVDADVFVSLSLYEAYSLVVAEALVAGTPCIVANSSALSEWVDNQSCFGVGTPLSLGKLAELINTILDNSVDKRAMKKWIGRKILDWDDVVARLENIYE